jgi:hypothetical protein
LETLHLTFNEETSAEAYFELTLSGDQPRRAGPVGLDGVYRIAPSPNPNSLAEAYRGYWSDPQTFVVDYDRIGNREGWIMKLRFEGDGAGVVDRVSAEARERSGSVVRAQGRVQEP